MQKESKEIIKLTTREILWSLADIAAAYLGGFEKSLSGKRMAREYFCQRDIDRTNFTQKIHYLKQRGLIRVFSENKTKYIELTPKGLEKATWQSIDLVSKNRPEQWDGLFRLVIFDVPEKKKLLRDVIRTKLEKIGFAQIQKSVFVYPFECKAAIDALCYFAGAKEYLKYMIAEVIEGEEDIIGHFLDTKILTRRDIKIGKKS